MLESYTSPITEDIINNRNVYEFDCCNIDYCKIHNAEFMKYSCLMGAFGPRCNIDEKTTIRNRAILEGFHF